MARVANEHGRLDNGLSTFLTQDRDNAAPAVHANALPVLDRVSRCTCADDGRQAIFARDNCRVTHGAADIGNSGGNLLKYWRPCRIRDLTNEYVAAAETANFVHRLYDARNTLGNAAGRRKTFDLVRVRL